MSNQIYDPDRRDFLKGMMIGAGGVAFGSMLIYPKEVMGQSIEGYLGKIPMDARWGVASGAYIGTTVNYFKILYEQRGKDKYIEFMKENGRLAQARYKATADRFGLPVTMQNQRLRFSRPWLLLGSAPSTNVKLKRPQRKERGSNVLIAYSGMLCKQ